MCIAIYQSVGHRLPREQLLQSWKSNPDGGGISYFNEYGDIVIEKDMELDGFMRTYERAVDRHAGYSPFAVHFRIATHGAVDIDNCHPFRMHDESSLIHNGIIPVLMAKGEPRSDTRVFVDEYLAKMPSGWLDDEQLFDMVEGYIGSSKLVILTQHGEYDSYIVNEQSGQWSDDRKFWYSNGSYKASKLVPWKVTTQLAIEVDELESPDDDGFDMCYMCGEEAVYDELCYNCETCQNCYEHDDDCKCGEPSRIHSMTDHEYMSQRGKR